MSPSLIISAVNRVSVGSVSIAWPICSLTAVLADAEQDMLAAAGGIAVVLREEILKDVVGGFAEDRVRRDQHRHAAEPSGRIFEQVKDVTAVT